jgi:hypothetical protein
MTKYSFTKQVLIAIYIGTTIVTNIIQCRTQHSKNYIKKSLLQCRINSSLFDEFVGKLGLFRHGWAILKRE